MVTWARVEDAGANREHQCPAWLHVVDTRGISARTRADFIRFFAVVGELWGDTDKEGEERFHIRYIFVCGYSRRRGDRQRRRGEISSDIFFAIVGELWRRQAKKERKDRNCLVS